MKLLSMILIGVLAGCGGVVAQIEGGGDGVGLSTDGSGTLSGDLDVGGNDVTNAADIRMVGTGIIYHDGIPWILFSSATLSGAWSASTSFESPIYNVGSTNGVTGDSSGGRYVQSGLFIDTNALISLIGDVSTPAFPLTADADFDGFAATNVLYQSFDTNGAHVAEIDLHCNQYVFGDKMYFVYKSVTNYLELQ